jgi:hypothetical protein
MRDSERGEEERATAGFDQRAGEVRTWLLCYGRLYGGPLATVGAALPCLVLASPSLTNRRARGSRLLSNATGHSRTFALAESKRRLPV